MNWTLARCSVIKKIIIEKIKKPGNYVPKNMLNQVFSLKWYYEYAHVYNKRGDTLIDFDFFSTLPQYGGSHYG